MRFAYGLQKDISAVAAAVDTTWNTGQVEGQINRLKTIKRQITLQQIRGKEGVRGRETYAEAARLTGVPWKARSYERSRWGRADAVNRALSAANSCLYGVCHAAIVALGYSPSLCFIHHGNMLLFVYDVADLHKAETTIPAAFRVAATEGTVESRVRREMRDRFRETRILDRVADDLAAILSIEAIQSEGGIDYDGELALPGRLWDPESGEVEGGVNYGDATEAKE